MRLQLHKFWKSFLNIWSQVFQRKEAVLFNIPKRESYTITLNDNKTKTTRGIRLTIKASTVVDHFLYPYDLNE